MGVIDIRMRSERLGNIGSVAPVHVPDFMGVVSMRNRANDALFHGLADGLDRGLRGASAIWATIQDREDQRQALTAMNGIRDEFDQFMEGSADGKVRGSFHADILKEYKDGPTWFKANGDTYNIIREKYTKDLTARQKELVGKGLADYRRGWETRQRTRMDQVYQKSIGEGLSGQFEHALKAASYDDASEDDISKAIKAREDLLDFEQIHDGDARTSQIAKVGESIMSARANRLVSNIQAATSGWEDRKLVGNEFDSVIKKIEDAEEGSLVGSPSLKSVLGESGVAQHKKDLLVALRKAKTSAENQADALMRHNKYLSVQDSQDEDIKFSQRPDFKDMSHAQLAEYYDAKCQRNSVAYDGADKAMYPTEKYAKTQYLADVALAKYHREKQKAADKAGEKAETKEQKEARVQLESELDHRMTDLELENVFAADDMGEEERKEFYERRNQLLIDLTTHYNGRAVSDSFASQRIAKLKRHFSEEQTELLRDVLDQMGYTRTDYATYRAAKKAAANKLGDAPTAIGSESHWWRSDTDVFIPNDILAKTMDVMEASIRRIPSGGDERAKFRDYVVDQIREYATHKDASKLYKSVGEGADRLTLEARRSQARALQNTKAYKEAKEKQSKTEEK